MVRIPAFTSWNVRVFTFIVLFLPVVAFVSNHCTAQDQPPSASIEELRSMNSEFSGKQDLSETGKSDLDRILMEGSGSSEDNIMKDAFLLSEESFDENLPGEMGSDIELINGGDIGIQTRAPLERLKTSEELRPLQKKERLKSLTLSEIEAKRSEQPGFLSILGKRSETREKQDSATVQTQWSRLSGVGYQENGDEKANIRSAQTVREDDLVRMNNSGRMVLPSRVEREEFKKRQERRSSRNSGGSSSGSSGSYLPGGGTTYLPNR
jgi:hypothetical protein